jgi:hypothetical protein
LEGADRYARDRAVATLEERGVTRRVVGELAQPGEKGEGAKAMVGAMIRAGATKYLRRLARTMPEGPERRTLYEMLEGAEKAPAAEEGAEASPWVGARAGEPSGNSQGGEGTGPLAPRRRADDAPSDGEPDQGQTP